MNVGEVMEKYAEELVKAECHAQYAILSERNSKVPPRIEPHIGTLMQGGYYYIVPLHNSWGYIQKAYRCHMNTSNIIHENNI